MKKRRGHLRVVKGEEKGFRGPDVVFDIDDMTDANVRAAFIVRFGPQCSGWLCNRFRRTIRKLGTFIVHIPEGKELPAWFDIAICYLEKHAKRWAVTRNVIRGVRYFRVFYTPKRKPTPIAIAIVPVGQS